MQIAVFSVDPGAVGLAGDGAGWISAPASHFGWKQIFWREKEVSHNSVCHWLSKISELRGFFP